MEWSAATAHQALPFGIAAIDRALPGGGQGRVEGIERHVVEGDHPAGTVAGHPRRARRPQDPAAPADHGAQRRDAERLQGLATLLSEFGRGRAG